MTQKQLISTLSALAAFATIAAIAFNGHGLHPPVMAAARR
jgi:hypothetical protein